MSTTVSFWDKNDYDGSEDSFKAAQRRSYLTPREWDSVKVGSSAWVVVWNNSDYTGDYLKLGPSTPNPDLKQTQRGSNPDNDWKHQISSFIMYAHQPSWWNASTPPPNDDLNLLPNTAVFCADSDFNDDTAVWTAPASQSDLNTYIYPTDTNRDMKNNITSIATGSSAWLEVWDNVNYTGSSMRVYNNRKLSDLHNQSRMPTGDWNDCIQSFKLYDAMPSSWVLGFDQDKFFSSFPGATSESDSSGPYYHYETQDAGYDIRINAITYPDASTMQLSYRVDYDLTGHNDKVDLELLINLDGSLNSISYTYSQGGAVQIPKSVIRAVDFTAEAAGLLGLVETAGISEAAADELIESFDTFCDVFNKISNGLFKFSESNDGRFYMVAVCSHVCNRALAAVTIN